MASRSYTMSAVYARMLRAYWRGEGIRLTNEDLALFVHDDALIMAALGGDSDTSELPDWLTPTERKRIESGDAGYMDVFKPGRS
jgi:hypothetical protein